MIDLTGQQQQAAAWDNSIFHFDDNLFQKVNRDATINMGQISQHTTKIILR